MTPAGELPRRIAMHYDLSLQLASLFALLIISENVTPESAASIGGDGSIYTLIYRLRRRLQDTDIEIRSRHTIGYWLDLDVRRYLADKFNLNLGIGI